LVSVTVTKHSVLVVFLLSVLVGVLLAVLLYRAAAKWTQGQGHCGAVVSGQRV